MIWRTLSDVPHATWQAVIRAAGGPDELATVGYAAARPHSALLLGMMGVESRWATTERLNKLANKNPLNLKMPLRPDGTRSPGFMAFGSWAAGVKAARERITSDTYGGGVYARTTTLAELIHVFAPASDNNNEQRYVRDVTAYVGSWPREEEPDVLDGIEFGAVPHPDYENRIIPSSDNSAWNDLGARDVKAVVWHRMLGSLWGTDGYFRGDGGNRALTDYGVGVAAQDGAENDGIILRWNDPLGKRSPWANGAVSAPYGDGLAFVNRYGVNGVNRYATAIEISGHQTTPLSEKSRNAIAGITAYWADRYELPWDAFPMVPGEDRSFVCWHEEFTIGTGKRCPFDTVKAETNALIERTRAVLKKYQTASDKPTPNPPTYADPKPPDWLAEDLERGYPIDHVEGGLTYFAALRPYEAIREANRLQGPDIKAPKVGPRLKVRETFRANYIVRTKEGRTFVLTPWGTFVDIKALTPRVSVRAA